MLNYRPTRLISTIVLSVVLHSSLFSQGLSDINWYFGNTTDALVFRQPNDVPEIITIANTLNLGGSAVATDPFSGALLFYGDARTIYDLTENVMPNGGGLGGNVDGNQPIVISRKPGDGNDSIYYVFTNTATPTIAGNLRVHEVDLRANGNGSGFPAPELGDVTLRDQSLTGIGNNTISQGMIVIPNAALDGFWLITHQVNSNSYNVTEIGNDGSFVRTLVYTAGPTLTAANISYHRASSRFAVSSQNQGEESVILDIRTTDGMIIGSSAIPGSGASSRANENIYDIEWSPNGQYIYLSGNFGVAEDDLVQFDLLNPGLGFTTVLPTPVNRSYGLQIGRDSTIYHLYQETTGGPLLLGRINDPDTVAAQVRYDASPLGNTDFQGRQFPAFLPEITPPVTPILSFVGTCQNAPTQFFAEVKPIPDSVRWDFGDGSGSTMLNPVYTYQAEGSYNVQLSVFYGNNVISSTLQVDIEPFDFQITNIPPDTVVCAFPIENIVAEGQGTGTPVYQWSNNAAPGPETQFDEPGNYWVIATVGNCATYAPIQARQYGQQEQFGNVWYFGDHAGLDFNPLFDNPAGPVTPIPFGDPGIFNGGNQMQAPEGCAVFCDANGEPLLHSDGNSIWNRNGDQVATDIGGDLNSTQSVIIVQLPDDPTIFYVFTTKQIFDPNGQESYELRYSVFDLKLNGGDGDVLRTNILLACNITERIASNGAWVIVHGFGNDIFQAFPITAAGIGIPVISNVGAVHPNNTQRGGEAYMTFSDNNLLAVGLSLANNENYVELFQFDPNTGEVTEYQPGFFRLEVENTIQGQIYGVEISGDLVYATIRNPGSGSTLYQWHIDSTTVAGSITDPSYINGDGRNVVAQENEDLGAIQTGPDGLVYVAVGGGSPTIGVINNPGAVIAADPPEDPNFVVDQRSLAPGTTSQLGLPNVITPPSGASDGRQFDVFDGCFGETLTFTATTDIPHIEFFQWRIVDSNGTEVVGVTPADNVNFTASRPGDYVAELLVVNICGVPLDPPLEFPFTVFPLPDFEIFDVQDVIGACGTPNGRIEFSVLDNQVFDYIITGPVSSGGQNVSAPTTIAATDLTAGAYTVNLTHAATGCASDSAVAINDDIQFGLVASTENADCDGQGGAIEITFTGPGNPVGNTGYVLRDQTNGSVVGSGTDMNPIPNIGVGTYSIEVTDSDSPPCTSSITDINVVSPPLADIVVPTDTAVCDEPSVDLEATTTTGTGITWSGPQGGFTVNGTIATITQAATYTATALGDDVNTCDNAQDVRVTFGGSTDPDELPRVAIICPEDPLPENSSTKLFPGPGFISANWFDEDGNPITGSTAGYDISGDTLIVFTAGAVTGEFTNIFDCVSSGEVNVIEDCRPRISAPNVFRPSSGIAVNQQFQVFPVFIQDFEIFIFSRWGELVFHSTDQNFRWNGGYDNDDSRPLPVGTYAYLIKFTSEFQPELGEQEQRGGVTLLR